MRSTHWLVDEAAPVGLASPMRSNRRPCGSSAVAHPVSAARCWAGEIDVVQHVEDHDHVARRQVERGVDACPRRRNAARTSAGRPRRRSCGVAAVGVARPSARCRCRRCRDRRSLGQADRPVRPRPAPLPRTACQQAGQQTLATTDVDAPGLAAGMSPRSSRQRKTGSRPSLPLREVVGEAAGVPAVRRAGRGLQQVRARPHPVSGLWWGTGKPGADGTASLCRGSGGLRRSAGVGGNTGHGVGQRLTAGCTARKPAATEGVASSGRQHVQQHRPAGRGAAPRCRRAAAGCRRRRGRWRGASSTRCGVGLRGCRSRAVSSSPGADPGGAAPGRGRGLRSPAGARKQCWAHGRS